MFTELELSDFWGPIMRVAMRLAALFFSVVPAVAGTEWEPAQWPHRAAVQIDHRAGRTDLDHYQVRVELDHKNFAFDRCQPNGADLRFADSHGRTLLPYWIERFDPAAGQAVLWVRVPQLRAGQVRSVQLHYGNPRAAAASDGRATFEFFDDCEQGQAGDRWQLARGKLDFRYVHYLDRFGRPGGVWHRSGAKTRLSPAGKTVYGGGHATYCSWTRPMAIYAPQVDKTFFAFGNADNRPTISAYDHRRKTLEPAATVGANKDMDAHRNPHLLIDAEGFLYLFYGSHCSPTYLARSQRPFDLHAWDSLGAVAENSSYPQPWQLRQGEIALFYRNGGTHNAGESCVRSRDRGRTWSSPQLIATSPPKNGLYAVSVAESGPYPRKIHMTWSATRGDWWQRYHLFYASSADGGLTWQRSDGRPYRLPITEPDAERVFRSDVPDHGVWLQDAQLDQAGRLHVLFVDGQTLTYDCCWRLATLAKGKWTVTRIAGCDHMYDHGALVPLADNDLRAYLPSIPVQPWEDGGQIVEWQSVDHGATWKSLRQLTHTSKYSHNHVKSVFQQVHGDFRVFWSYGDSADPPQTRDVTLFRYGEQLAAPEPLDPRYPPEQFPGRFLLLSRPERIDSLLAIKGLRMADAAVAARVMPAGPNRQHAMLCARIGVSGSLYAGGFPKGRAKLYLDRERWTPLAEQNSPDVSTGWHAWELALAGDRLQLAADGRPALETRDATLGDGGWGVRTFDTELLVDDVRVRRLTLPEPMAAVQRQGTVRE
jgi:hypothetical protein